MTAPAELEQQLDRLGRLDSAIVSDAADQLGLATVAPAPTRLWPCAPMVGRAITVALRRAGPQERSSHHLGSEAVARSGPHDVIVVANGGRRDSGAWGGLLSRGAHAKSARGAVVDGVVRDVGEAEDLGFPLFALGSTPVTARGRTVEVSTGDEVLFDGIRVATGDLVIADSTGVVFLPTGHATAILDAAERLAVREAAMAERLANGEDIREVMGTSYEMLLETS